MFKKVRKRINHKLSLSVFIKASLLTAFIFFYPLFFYIALFWGKIYPNIKVADTDVSGKKKDEAVKILKSKFENLNSITLLNNNQSYTFSFDDLGISYNYQNTIENAFRQGRTGDLIKDLHFILTSFKNKKNLPLIVEINRDLLQKNINSVSSQEIAPLGPQISIESKQIKILEGKPGYVIDVDKLGENIQKEVSLGKFEKITIPFKYEDHSLSDIEIRNLRLRGEKFLDTRLILKLKDSTLIYKDDEIISLVEPLGGYKSEKLNEFVDSIALGLDMEPENATFVFGLASPQRVEEFKPARDGIKIDKSLLKEKIKFALSQIENNNQKEQEIDIPYTLLHPKITNKDVNNFGIKELLGRGSSLFQGSIASRIHNIVLASSRLNGILVAPGEIFSFNDSLGDVSAYTGYQPAYIIKEGRTVLGDGGGVCQVSTTLFRAVLQAGLPIMERHAHAYRVHYYEEDSPAGFDATVFSPSVDLKFKNDTPAYILIQSKVDTKNLTLVFDLYGTFDGRKVEISKPKIWDVSAPPPPLYQDDPTLPFGKIKQVDFESWGAKASFNYKVILGDRVLEDEIFYSNYRPWQAVYLRGTKQ